MVHSTSARWCSTNGAPAAARDSTFVGTSGPVSLSVSFANGCFSMGGTVLTEVLTSPGTPSITDSQGYNTASVLRPPSSSARATA